MVPGGVVGLVDGTGVDEAQDASTRDVINISPVNNLFIADLLQIKIIAAVS